MILVTVVTVKADKIFWFDLFYLRTAERWTDETDSRIANHGGTSARG
jgi:hypothetical protein